jgi:hypothetical protein
MRYFLKIRDNRMVSPVCGKVNDSFPYDGYIYMKKALAVASAFLWQGHKDLNS